FLRFEPQRGLEPGQGEIGVIAPDHRAWQHEAPGIAALRLLLDLWAPGIPEPQQLRGLVERLAHRIIERGAEPGVLTDAMPGHDLRMTAGREKQAIGKRGAVGEAGGERMRLEMVDGDQWLARDQGDRLGGGQTDDDATDQARACGGGNTVDRLERLP